MNEQTRVLIVDDDVGLSESLSLILTRKGYRVVTVKDGTAAVEEARKQHYDLILIDVLMPGKSGLDTLRELKTIDSHARMVMMTGFAVAGMVAEAIEVGVDGVLYKPYDVEIVVNALMSPDVLRLFEGYLKSAWDRVTPVLGARIAQSVFQRAVSICAEEEGSLLGDVQVTLEGISLEGLRHLVDAGRADEVRLQLQHLLSTVFTFLRTLTSSILADPLTRVLSDELKRESV